MRAKIDAETRRRGDAVTKAFSPRPRVSASPRLCNFVSPCPALLILINHTQDCFRIRWSDALLLFNCEAQIVCTLHAPARLKLLVAVDIEKLFLGRLVVDAIKARQT